MHFPILSGIALASVLAPAIAHPELVDHSKVPRHEVHHLNSRSTGACKVQIEARRQATAAKRGAKARTRREARGVSDSHALSDRSIYETIPNRTCILAPETVWGPYGIDNELHRHDVRESQSGINLYLDIGLIDVETCEPLPDAWLTIWACNATGSYSGFTGIDPDTSDLLSGFEKRTDGTTDDKTFLRGISKTDSEGMTEFLTIFPGYYISRTTHIHVTVQTNVTGKDTSYNQASVQHLGQLFFEEELINSVYQLQPYKDHLSTLNRTTNAEDSLYSTANSDGYSAVVSTALLGHVIADGLVGSITIGVNRSATPAETTGGSVNVVGYLPTASPTAGAQAAAYVIDAEEGYFEKRRKL
ncbi:hypothetical protein N7494_000973 [Penicillium frequentans]|uniref:Intradiol ring-cleavage dioxygenases domain-containing protein n=1 Tax=Penicillium frequentans TaxID=3151616 RepID=A0AAD6GLT8_9EURO|nr:hypothetical protein N7494_000973 [Penicillium glabrum]